MVMSLLSFFDLYTRLGFFAGGLGIILLARVIASRRKRNPLRLPLPPGPKGLPLVGNIYDMPQERPWEGYDEMCKEYGDVVYLTALGQGFLVLGTHSRAVDLLEKRAVKYSDRPEHVLLDLLNVRWSFATMRYGSQWRKYRRTFHQYHGQKAVVKHHAILYEERDIALRKVREHPEDFIHHLEVMIGQGIMRTTYGLEDEDKNTYLIQLGDRMMKAFTEATTPGRFLVNIIPALRHVPSWVPGAGWQKWFKVIARGHQDILETGFEMAKEEMAKGMRSAYPNMATDLLDRVNDETLSASDKAEIEDMAKAVCAVTYLGGSETTFASITGLFLVLANHPEVQKKAQAELDAFLGKDRLPLVTDREALPYVHAVVKELMRWYTVAPLSLSHATAEDDEYEGYFIPKGTIVIPNSWAMLHDPNAFDNPFDFIPERYLKDGMIDPSVPDVEMAGFGFGRRICPGRHFAMDTIFLWAASVLATFDVAQPKDEAGNRVPLELQLRFELVAKPAPFKCKITVRDGREGLIPTA